jgi:hypothetical protein
MKITTLLMLVLLMAFPSISSAEKKGNPEDQIRQHLKLPPNTTIDLWKIRAKVLTAVHIGQPWQEVEKAISVFGLKRSLSRSTDTQKPQCWPGDNGLVCEFKADASDPGGKRAYWIEFFYWKNEQVLEDVAVTLFKGKKVQSTSKFYTEN